MPIDNVTSSAVYSLSRAIKDYLAPVIWSAANNRLVQIIKNDYGLLSKVFAASFMLGAATAWAIDVYFSDVKKINEKQSAYGLAYCAGIAMPAMFFWMKATQSDINASLTKTAIIYSSFSAGILLGMKAKEYYNYKSSSNIDSFVQVIGNEFNRLNYKLDLSSYTAHLRSLDLVKLNTAIRKAFPTYTKLILNNNDLTYAGLSSLGKAGWFNNVKGLDLTNTNLKDDDLRQMAESGYFKGLEMLCIANNPRITPIGLEWIGKRGFENLKRLDVSCNKLVFTGSDWWKEGFSRIEVLELIDTDITENILERMIDEADWFRNLKGLDLSWNDKLDRFPSNILQLINLDDQSVTESQLLSNGRIYFHGSGLFFRKCDKLIYTQELLALVKADKAFGTISNGSNPWGAARHLDLEGLCKVYKVPYIA